MKLFGNCCKPMVIKESRGRLAGFDGLRAIALFSTVWMHLVLSSALTTTLPLSLGRQGVALFFALSGFLITRSLLEDGSLGRFYWKRALKILPSLYLYLGVVAILRGAGVYLVPLGSLAAAATCWINWYPDYRGWPLEHIWSLGVEEQFYLVWPLILCATGSGRAIGLVVTVLLGWPVQRWLRQGHFSHPSVDDALFSVTFDTILWGCLAGLVLNRWPALVGRLVSSWSGLAAAGLLSLCYLGSAWVPPGIVPQVRGLAFGWLFLWLEQHPNGSGARLLNWRPLAWLGRRSYSIYLWHILFCDIRMVQLFGLTGSLLLGLGISCAAYALVEAKCSSRYKPSGTREEIPGSPQSPEDGHSP